MAGGDVRITVSNRSFPTTHRVVPHDEAAQILADYQYDNRYVRPLINRMLSYLAGWRYDGSMDARRRLVEQLPIFTLQAISP